MDYDLLLEGCSEVGSRLISCGGEITRAEDTVRRLMAAYHVESEVFAIPNCLIVSISDGEGHIHTRMRRPAPPATDIALLESYNALSRRLCADPPADPTEILKEVWAIDEETPHFPWYAHLMGGIVGAFFFTLLFCGNLSDAVGGALAGMLATLTSLGLGRLKCNYFISTVLSSIVLETTVCVLLLRGANINPALASAGALMVLVPGLVFTNFMRELLTGDIIAGLSTFTRAILCAGAIALGTASMLSLFRHFCAVPEGSSVVMTYSIWVHFLVAFFGSYAFCFTFNVRGVGAMLCSLGGGVGWAVFQLLSPMVGGSPFIPTLAASISVAIYAEVMARIRKCPTTAYLMISFFPLVPGLTIYQALNYGILGDLQNFWEALNRTFGISGCLALGALIISSITHVLNGLRTREPRLKHRHFHLL